MTVRIIPRKRTKGSQVFINPPMLQGREYRVLQRDRHRIRMGKSEQFGAAEKREGEAWLFSALLAMLHQYCKVFGSSVSCILPVDGQNNWQVSTAQSHGSHVTPADLGFRMLGTRQEDKKGENRVELRVGYRHVKVKDRRQWRKEEAVADV